MSDDEDGPIALRPDTLAALQAFLAERDAAVAAAQTEAEDTSSTLKMVEDYGLSQFWYSQETCDFLAAEVGRCLEDVAAARGGAPGTAVFISSPSAYKGYRALAAAGRAPPGADVMLLEYDSRFAVFGDAFARYDFNTPEVFPEKLRGAVDVIMFDPPFLNEVCLSAFAATIKAMVRGDGSSKILLASGAVQLVHARALLGLRPTRAAIKHEGGRLSNPFALYANYERQETLGGWDVEAEAAAAKDAAATTGGGSGEGSA